VTCRTGAAVDGAGMTVIRVTKSLQAAPAELCVPASWRCEVEGGRSAAMFRAFRKCLFHSGVTRRVASPIWNGSPGGDRIGDRPIRMRHSCYRRTATIGSALDRSRRLHKCVCEAIDSAPDRQTSNSK